jgi:hypothetical protein
LATPIKVTIGKAPSVYIDKPDARVKCVCSSCNSQWMSDLESANKPAIRAMINGDSYWLTEKDQWFLVRWVLMKAMVIESANRRRPFFYDSQKKGQVKTGSAIPVGTLVWLGRISEKAFHAGGTDIWGEIDEISRAVHGCVTSIVVGHLAIQVLSGHVVQQFGSHKINLSCKQGAWHLNLLDIWPTTGPVRWPPSISFTLKGPDSIANLISRWKIGRNVG